MLRIAASLFIGCLLASGCGGLEDSSLVVTSGSSGVVTWSGSRGARPGIDRASVFHVGSMLVIWSDLSRGGGGGSSSNMHGLSCEGQLLGEDGHTVKYRCEAKTATTGTVTIDGQSFDLEDGNLLLVTLDGTTCRVKQLRRDLKHLNFNRRTLRRFAERDAEIGEFFAGE
jgi:hypothetical protein